MQLNLKMKCYLCRLIISYNWQTYRGALHIALYYFTCQPD